MRIRDRMTALRSGSSGVDTHDVGAFRRVIGRTGAIRIVLACGALALVLAAAASARDPSTNDTALIPPDRVGVVVLDLSLSITDSDYAAIRRTLRRLVAEEATIGLVIFSDVPYEALPPGTPADELKPMLRLLVAPRLGPVQNPWTQTFRAGTRISVALELARGMLDRDQVAAGSVLLVSDLETAPEDVLPLARTISELDRDDVALRVVPLAPSSDALSLFAEYIDETSLGGFGEQAPGSEQSAARPAAVKLPLVLLALGVLAFVLLALHERFSGRLALPRPSRADGEPA